MDPFEDSAKTGGRHNLVETTIKLITDPKFRELIIVQGSPGCGKSAFTLRLANALLTRGLRPILVRFRNLRLSTFDRVDELLEDALRIGPVNQEPPRPTQQIITNNALNRTARLNGVEIAELVFVLNGWDEVSLTGSASYQVQLQKWLPRIREFFVGRPGHPVRLVLTGRPSPHVRQSGILKRDTQILTLRHMCPSALRGFANAIAERVNHPLKRLQSSWKLDAGRLEAVFERYERWFNSVGQGENKIGAWMLSEPHF